jgi:hypothetical protein
LRGSGGGQPTVTMIYAQASLRTLKFNQSWSALVTLPQHEVILHAYIITSRQGCQMVCFQTKNPNLGKFWRVFLWKILVYFMTIWSILRSSEILNGHLVYFVVIWYIFPNFGILDQEKSGNPTSRSLTHI